jgi:hypothetical protein
MLLAGAFVYICFISVGKFISRALYIFKASPHPCFPWMVVMDQLVPASVAHIAERSDEHSRKVAADAAVRQRCHHTYYQWLSHACDPDPAFDLP